ncbi:MAG: MoxR family ATPase [Cyanobacteria bacterium REEB65]|nr:MoxR family ATPase [Cyanobacteria bacterium REEB65]
MGRRERQRRAALERPVGPRPDGRSRRRGLDGRGLLGGAPVTPTGPAGPQAILANLRRAIVGHDDRMPLIVAALLAGGHILLDDVPGVGKTLLAKTLAQSISGTFKRVQFSPDLLPSDVTGVNIFEQGSGRFRFVPGPLFANVLLADEINRASPRTQSCLLEAMEEGCVTVDGEGYALPRPFWVVATQNPIEFQGTFPLPEAQIDRFAICVQLGYPEPAEEVQLLAGHWARLDTVAVEQVADLAQLAAWQEEIRGIHVDSSLQEYIVRVLTATRADPRMVLGVSPRGGLVWQRLSQAHAFLAGRSYVVPGDLQAVAEACLNHRLVLAGKSSRAMRTDLLADLVASIAVPV